MACAKYAFKLDGRCTTWKSVHLTPSIHQFPNTWNSFMQRQNNHGNHSKPSQICSYTWKSIELFFSYIQNPAIREWGKGMQIYVIKRRESEKNLKCRSQHVGSCWYFALIHSSNCRARLINLIEYQACLLFSHSTVWLSVCVSEAITLSDPLAPVNARFIWVQLSGV